MCPELKKWIVEELIASGATCEAFIVNSNLKTGRETERGESEISEKNFTTIPRQFSQISYFLSPQALFLFHILS